MNSEPSPTTSEEAIVSGLRDIESKFGIRFQKFEKGEAISELILTDAHRNMYGIPYGGILFNMADDTAGIAFLSAGGLGVTVNGSANYLRGATPNTKKLICHAQVRKGGKRIFFVSAEISDENGTVLSDYSFIFANAVPKR